jgi:hypothetical protein
VASQTLAVFLLLNPIKGQICAGLIKPAPGGVTEDDSPCGGFIIW